MIPREQFDAYNRSVANLSDGAQREIESGIWAWLQTDEGRAASVAECREYAKGVMSGVIQRYDEAAPRSRRSGTTSRPPMRTSSSPPR